MPLGGLVTERRNSEENRYVDRTEMRFTSPEVLELERKMIRDVERIVKAPGGASPANLVEESIRKASPALDREQAEAVRYLLTGAGIRLCSGLAGTGKTHMLNTCHEVWRKEGREVLGCALAGAAAQRLGEKTGIACDTLDRTLHQLDSGRIVLTSRSVIVADEAGMIGTRQMARLIEHVAKAPEGTRLIMVGDSRQLQSIDSGGAFKYLASTLGETRLENVRRQREEWMREAVKDFERGKAAEAIREFRDRGHVHLAESGPAAMAALLEQWKKDGGIKNPAGVFLLAATNSEVREINLRAQAERIRAGEVDPERKIFANGVYIHEGDRIQFQKNSRVLGVTNSDTATVLRVDQARQRISVKLDKDERELTVNFARYSPQNLRLGFASTVHKCQGASLPKVHVLLGSSGLLDLHMGYVMASRSIESTHFFCDKSAAQKPELADLIKSLSRERQKTLAHELLHEQEDQRRNDVIRNTQGVPL